LRVYGYGPCASGTKKFEPVLALLTHVAFATSWENARLIGGELLSPISEKEKSKKLICEAGMKKRKNVG
jgi:hypothetical protein